LVTMKKIAITTSMPATAPAMPSLRAARLVRRREHDLAVTGSIDLARDHRAEPAVGRNEVAAQQPAKHDHDHQAGADPEVPEVVVGVGRLVHAGRKHHD
jgi:hypothetical protein